jgi:glyoxylate utilization-related uncharacterized protein
MSTTLIKTESVPRQQLDGHGETAEILNRQLCGAENVVGKLHWLDSSQQFEAEALADTHQLLYLMEGEGTISLNDKDYDVGKGAGIYLGPSETARIRQRGAARLKLFHLVVPIRSELQLNT